MPSNIILGRKMSRGKWGESKSGYGVFNIPADAISNDLKTSRNNLSFWRTDVEKKDDVILAIIGTLETLDTIDIVLVEERELRFLNFVSTPGKTFPVNCYLHVDAVDLNHLTIVQVAKSLGQMVYSERHIRLTFSEIKNRLYAALNQGKISWSDLKGESVKKRLNRRKSVEANIDLESLKRIHAARQGSQTSATVKDFFESCEDSGRGQIKWTDVPTGVAEELDRRSPETA